jgi:starvation-inducible DNA-binding protein
MPDAQTLQERSRSDFQKPIGRDQAEGPRMQKTKNDLPETTRSDMAELLNSRLADSIDLMHQAKQAHWNVRGPSFIALHKLFDEIVDSVEEYIDLIAERIAQLGGTTYGTIQLAVRHSTLNEYPPEISAEHEHIEALSSSLAAFGKGMRRAIAQADEQCDRDTADIFTEISRGGDKYLWFVEAHLG